MNPLFNERASLLRLVRLAVCPPSDSFWKVPGSCAWVLAEGERRSWDKASSGDEAVSSSSLNMPRISSALTRGFLEAGASSSSSRCSCCSISFGKCTAGGGVAALGLCTEASSHGTLCKPDYTVIRITYRIILDSFCLSQIPRPLSLWLTLCFIQPESLQSERLLTLSQTWSTLSVWTAEGWAAS